MASSADTQRGLGRYITRQQFRLMLLCSTSGVSILQGAPTYADARWAMLAHCLVQLPHGVELSRLSLFTLVALLLTPVVDVLNLCCHLILPHQPL